MMLEFNFSSHAEHSLDERGLSPEWVRRVLDGPVLRLPDELDPELEHFLAPIKEADNRALRVIVNTQKSPWLVVTAYFDRRMRGKL